MIVYIVGPYKYSNSTFLKGTRMNERIQELLEQSKEYIEQPLPNDIYNMGDNVFRRYEVINQQKFAELIVEECARRCDVVRESNGGDKQFGARLCADEIRSINRRS